MTGERQPVPDFAQTAPASPPPTTESTALASVAAAPAAAATPVVLPTAAITRHLTFSSSADIGELIAALAAAQLKFGAVERTLTASVQSRREGARSYSYDYAPLVEVLRAVRSALAENGVAILQPPLVAQRSVTVTTLLAHPSNQWIRNDLTVGLDSTDPQAIGSAITYARRYGLMALLGVAPEDDDDGQAAQTKPRTGRVVPMPERASASSAPASSSRLEPGMSPSSGGAPAPGKQRLVVTNVKTRGTPPAFWEADIGDRHVMTLNPEIGQRLMVWETLKQPIAELATKPRTDKAGVVWNEIEEVVADTGVRS